MAHNYAEIITAFTAYTKTLGTEDFIRSTLLCFCAPTITGLKAATLMNFRRASHEDMRSAWLKNAGKWLDPLGVKWLMLNEECLVLIYRRELLARALGCSEACTILAEHGYPLHDVDACLECLKRKFREGLPHEIGLFLDYPPDDVRGFIENRCAKKLSCPCYWKVYGNVREAKRKFTEYKKAECEAARRILAGE
ncbi:MAG: DUF3793 family protein [Synergistaceae bacterium]|nr:DUF3793 family protein [Synergistaceae bacterium]